MKKMNLLIALFAVFSLMFVGCGKDVDPTPAPEPEKPGPVETVEQEFSIAIDRLTYNVVEYTITPTVLDANYLCALYDAATVEEFTKDEYLILTLYQELEAEARTVGMTLEEYLPQYLDKGVTSGSFSPLAPESDYYIIVVGVDEAKGYKANTELFKYKFTTEAAPVLEVTFEIETTVEGNTAKFLVTPSDPEAIWYFYTVPTEVYTAYQDPQYYNMTPEDFLLYCVQSQIDAYRNAGYSDNQILNALFHKGTLQLQVKDLTPNTDYTNIIAGFVIDDTGAINIATGVTTTTYKTGDAPAVDLTFNIEVSNIEATKASIKVTPSDLTQKFFWLVNPWDGVSSVEDIIDELYPMYAGMWNSGWGLYTGVQDYTGGPGSPYKMTLDAPDTDYFVIAVGYTPGVGFVGTPSMTTFRTLPAGNAEDVLFNVAVDAATISPYGFTVDLTSSDTTTYYFIDIVTPESFDADAVTAEYNAAIDEIFAEYQAYYGSSYTMSQFLASNYYRGSQKISVSGLEPATTYMSYVCALDIKTGHIVKMQTFDNLATTKALSSVVPSFKSIKHYSGTDEAGSIFGQPALTAGRSITVVEYGDIENARSLFAYMTEGDVTNPNNYPDGDVWSMVGDYWDSVSVKQPYSFYVTNWDVEQTVLAYAVDKNSGAPGAIARMLTCASVENKSDIQELRDLVSELNAQQSSTRFSMPASLVVEEQPRRVIECVTEQPAAVAMPQPAAPQANELSLPLVYIE